MSTSSSSTTATTTSTTTTTRSSLPLISERNSVVEYNSDNDDDDDDINESEDGGDNFYGTATRFFDRCSDDDDDDEDERSERKKAKVVHHNELYEVLCNKKTIFDDKPITVGCAILAESKLLFCQFMKFLFDHVRPGMLKICYCDTDSITLATTNCLEPGLNCDDLPRLYRSIFEPILKDNMRESWSCKMKTWFVLDEQNLDDCLCPGKLKREFSPLHQHRHF